MCRSSLSDTRDRVTVFDCFDGDHDGAINRKEFQQLAYECGIDMRVLTEEGISAGSVRSLG